MAKNMTLHDCIEEAIKGLDEYLLTVPHYVPDPEDYREDVIQNVLQNYEGFTYDEIADMYDEQFGGGTGFDFEIEVQICLTEEEVQSLCKEFGITRKELKEAITMCIERAADWANEDFEGWLTRHKELYEEWAADDYSFIEYLRNQP